MLESHFNKLIVSTNSKRQFSNGQEMSNNQEEADTLIIHTFEQMKSINYNVILFIVETLQDIIM